MKRSTKTIGFGKKNYIAYYNHNPRIVYYDETADLGSRNLNYWYDQNFEIGTIFPKPCPNNPETITVEITNGDLEKLSHIASYIGSLISIEIPPVPIDERQGECDCP